LVETFAALVVASLAEQVVELALALALQLLEKNQDNIVEYNSMLGL
jgi:hypothetical protein